MLVVSLLTSCLKKEVEQVPIIEGRIENCSHNSIFLYNNEDPLMAIDTIKINKDGFFTVPKKSITHIGFYSLKFSNSDEVLFFLRPSDFVSFQFNEKNIVETCKSNNSNLLNAIWDLKRSHALFAREMDSLSYQLNEMSGKAINDSLFKSLNVKRDSLILTYKTQSINVSKGVNSPVVTFLMLNQKHGNVSLFSLKDDLDLFLNNEEELMKDDQLKELFATYDQNLMKAYSSIRAEQRYHAGGKFRTLKAYTNWDQELPLKKINGNPLHVILWSGIDFKDEQKLSEIKRLNMKYKARGLKTLMVAYQKDKEVWLNSIKKNKLSFWHLIDTTEFNSVDLVEMGVRYLPCNFVVDTTGTIINRDVWGGDLDKLIGRYYKKY